MTDAAGLPPPGLILILGGLLLPLLRGAAPAVALALPVLTLAAIWLIPGDLTVTAPFMDGLTLTVLSWQPATAVFATIFALMAFGGALFAHPNTGLDSERGKRWRVELPAAFVYAGSAICVTFAGDILTLFMFWELMAIGSTIVVWSAGTAASGRAGFRYALVHLVGGVVLMAGILAKVFALQAAGVADPLSLTHFAFGAAGFDALSCGPGDVAAWLILLGVLVNAAAPPLGAWLPDAYPEASESGTVFLSAFTTKTAVYVLMLLFAGTELLIYVGLAMAVYGIVYAILENDMRRILAYSIVNQVGFMVCGIGIGTAMALNGAAAHAFAHIIYKALLLMSAGSVLYMTGKRKCTDLGGLYHSMPITMTCGIIGALAISSFPLTSGFVTKSMINQAAADQHLALAWFVLTAASAGVFLHAGIKFPWFVFFQKDSGMRPAEPAAEHARGDDPVRRPVRRPRHPRPLRPALQHPPVPGPRRPDALRPLHAVARDQPAPAAAVLGPRVLHPAAGPQAHADDHPRQRLAVPPPRPRHLEAPAVPDPRHARRDPRRLHRRPARRHQARHLLAPAGGRVVPRVGPRRRDDRDLRDPVRVPRARLHVSTRRTAPRREPTTAGRRWPPAVSTWRRPRPSSPRPARPSPTCPSA
jgi:multicomponent Na+:H+ antiporter subunit D